MRCGPMARQSAVNRKISGSSPDTAAREEKMIKRALHFSDYTFLSDMVVQ